MSKKKNKMQSIADILPENLSEETVNKVAELVNEAIQDEVARQVDALSTKFHGLLRLKIDEMKEHARAELEAEDPEFRNHEIMESIKGMLALEVAPQNVDALVETQLNEAAEAVADSKAVESELDSLLTENETLKRTLKLVESKLHQLDQERKKLHIQLEHKKADLQESRLQGQAKLETRSIDEARAEPKAKWNDSLVPGVNLEELRRLANIN